MTFAEIMQAYFRGERIEALWFIAPIGAALLLTALMLWRVETRSYALGATIPLVLFGLIYLGTGLGVGLRTPAQVARIEAAVAEAPADLRQAETARMQGVMRNFVLTRWALAALVLGGLGLLLFLHRDWAAGAGWALVVAAAMGLGIDSVAERRAEPYLAALATLPTAD